MKRQDIINLVKVPNGVSLPKKTQNNKMKDSVIKYINELEGFKTAIKNLHWSSSNMNVHKLFDDIADSVSNIQDEVSEMEQGLHGQIAKNTLKPVQYTIESDTKFLSDILDKTKTFYNTIKEDEYIGIRSSIESFIGELNKYQYLMKLSLKENLIKKFKGETLNEAFKSKKLDALNRQHGGLDWGAYNASELTDDEIGDTFERGGRHFNSNHDITFKDGSGVHVNPTKAHRNINNGFRMTPDKEGYDRHAELSRRNHWSGRELPRDEYWSRNPHYNKIKNGFGNIENGKHKLHHSWKDNFKPGEMTDQGHFMSYNGQGEGYGSYGGEEEFGTGMNHRLSKVDHAKDWYNMKNMDRQQKRDYLERKYKGKLHPALYHDFENENTKKDMNNTIRLTEAQLYRVIKESVKKVLKEGDWDTPKRQKALKQVAGRAFADSDRLTKMGKHDEAQKRFQVGADAHQRLNDSPSKSDMQNDDDFKEGMKKSWSTGRFAKGGKFGKK